MSRIASLTEKIQQEGSISSLLTSCNMDSRSSFDNPSYAGEDIRPTSTKEINGWYSYGWAAEVFVVCGIGSFIPITLEQLGKSTRHNI